MEKEFKNIQEIEEALNILIEQLWNDIKDKPISIPKELIEKIFYLNNLLKEKRIK